MEPDKIFRYTMKQSLEIQLSDSLSMNISLLLLINGSSIPIIVEVAIVIVGPKHKNQTWIQSTLKFRNRCTFENSPKQLR